MLPVRECTKRVRLYKQLRLKVCLRTEHNLVLSRHGLPAAFRGEVFIHTRALRHNPTHLMGGSLGLPNQQTVPSSKNTKLLNHLLSW